MMNRDILNTILLAGAFLLLFALAEVLYHFLKVKAELTRKLVHFGTGILTLLFPVLLNNSWLVLILCTSFALILILSLKFNLLKSINAIDRKSYGSLCYPLAVYICYFFYEWYNSQNHASGGYLIFYLPILILAISDPLAALFGKKWPIGVYQVGCGKKSLMGSAAFFISAFILSLSLIIFHFHLAFPAWQIFLICVLIAFVTAFAEAISQNGMDNLYIPVTGTITTYLSLTYLL